MTKAELIQENKELREIVDKLESKVLFLEREKDSSKRFIHTRNRLAIEVLKTTLGVE